MRGVDDGPDGLNDAAFDRALKSVTCEHLVMSSCGVVCGAPAKFRISVAGQFVTLAINGAKVSTVCGRHANTIATWRPGTTLIPLRRRAAGKDPR